MHELPLETLDPPICTSTQRQTQGLEITFLNILRKELETLQKHPSSLKEVAG